jgi:hypothetical protein
VAAFIFSWCGWVSRVFGHCTQNRGKRRGHWDPCPSLLDGDTGSKKPPNKEAGPYAWGGSYGRSTESDLYKEFWRSNTTPHHTTERALSQQPRSISKRDKTGTFLRPQTATLEIVPGSLIKLFIWRTGLGVFQVHVHAKPGLSACRAKTNHATHSTPSLLKCPNSARTTLDV